MRAKTGGQRQASAYIAQLASVYRYFITRTATRGPARTSGAMMPDRANSGDIDLQSLQVHWWPRRGLGAIGLQVDKFKYMFIVAFSSFIARSSKKMAGTLNIQAAPAGDRGSFNRME
jgi:hypothetical protein